jgi:proline iminopeptidase
MYWYDPTFDAGPLFEGVDVNMPAYIQLFDIYGDDYRVEPPEVPVFLALGRHDYIAPFHLWDEPKQRFQMLRYALYDKSGHTPPLEQPREFADDLTAWARLL